MLDRDAVNAGEPAHILVVDDEPFMCRILEVNLQRAGYRVTCVHRLNAAREMIAKNRPDAVLLDMWLPGDLNALPPDTGYGFDLSRELSDDPTTADLPVIIMAAKSAVADPYGRDTAPWLERQGRPYVFKPFLPQVMQTILTLLKEAPMDGDAPGATQSVQDRLI